MVGTWGVTAVVIVMQWMLVVSGEQPSACQRSHRANTGFICELVVNNLLTRDIKLINTMDP